MMGKHDQLSDKALSRLLVAGGLARVAALAGIVLRVYRKTSARFGVLGAMV